MKFLPSLASRIRALFLRDKLEADMAEQMRVHLEMSIERNIAAGMSPEDARFAAMRKFGGLEQIKEQCRDERRWLWTEQAAQDVRYAARTFGRQRGLSAVIVLTLALGIGLNTVVFTFYGAVALKPLPVRAPAEIVRVRASEGERTNYDFAFREFENIGKATRSFSSVIATSEPQIVAATMLGAGSTRTELVSVRLVSENYFPGLGVVPTVGRSFGANDAPGAVLSYEFWKSRYSQDPAVLGQTIVINDVTVTILGVAPAAFAGTGLPAQSPQLWLPLTLQPAIMPKADWLRSDAREWQILARLSSGASVDQASVEIGAVQNARPGAGRPRRLSAKAATFFQTDSGEFQLFKAVIPVVMVAEGLILLIGCVNVINLLSARNAARSREIAIRLALGATRFRLVRQLCAESVLLGLVGGAGGLLLSYWFGEVIRVWFVATFTKISAGALSVFLDTTPDWRVFAYTVGLSLLVGAVVGIVPAWRGTRTDLEAALREASSARGGPSPLNRRHLLLTGQVAASLFLLVGAGVFFGGAKRANHTDPGFDPKNLVVVAIKLGVTAQNEQGRARLIKSVIDRARELPEVESVAWADHPPFWGRSIGSFKNEKGVKESWALNAISANYFDTVGLPVVAGRAFGSQEVSDGNAVVIVNETAARHLWPGKNPLGQKVSSPGLSKQWKHDSFTVVGVVKDARTTLLSKADGVNVYFPRPLPTGTVQLLLRSRGSPERAMRSFYGVLSAIDSNLASQSWMMRLEGGPVEAQRLMSEAPAVVLSVLGSIALMLAGAGIYGVVSFLVTRRSREIGIRIALGAQNRDILLMVLNQTLRPLAWGACLGMVGALGLLAFAARWWANPETPDLTYGAGMLPFGTLFSAVGTLLAVGLLASFLPARRATRVDPIVALRAE